VSQIATTTSRGAPQTSDNQASDNQTSDQLKPAPARFPARFIVGMRTHATSYAAATRQVLDWAKERTPRYVCVANVHMVMETHDDPQFRQIVNRADLVTSDGMPLVWALRGLGVPQASRVYGPTLTLHVCEGAAREGVPVALYGGTPESLADFAALLRSRYPGIQVVCQIAPPFRALSSEEDERYTHELQESGAGVVFVGIGCPKQERWMAEHTARLNAVLLGVGAAFDFHSGRVKQAPAVMQRSGLEWLFRLAVEPRRLWKRYTRHNPRFVWLVARQLLAHRLAPHRTAAQEA
jgi:N-acetylglucosaminyldiphosphoundecaprenol N-acetyl-beta-D-mannosaminyltransferase